MRSSCFFAPRRLLTTLWLLAIGLVPGLRAQELAPVPVVTMEAQRRIVTERFTLTGTVTPRQQAALSPRASGLVQAVHVDAGAHVEPGSPLVSLDSTLAELARQAAAAQHAEAQARLAESQRLLAEARRLLDRNSIPETQVMTREADVAMATAAARRAEVVLRERQEIVDRHQVIAPFRGVITHKLTEVGEWVTTGTPVMRLVSLAGARVDVQVPQERLAAITPDTPVEFAVSTAEDLSLTGVITARIPVSSPDTRTALVRIEPRDASVRLVPGKSARVSFLLRSDQPVLTVPRDAVIRRADGTVNLWIATPQDDTWIATLRRIDLGRTYSDHLEVQTGLEPGQQVIIRGNETLRPDQPVQIAPPDPSL